MRFKICFLSILNPYDHKSWSGIPHQLITNISKYHDVTWVSASGMPKWKHKLLVLQTTIHKYLKWKFTYHTILYAKFLSKIVKQKIEAGSFDFVLLGAGESPLIAYLQVKQPIIYVADTTFANMVDYYPWHTNLSRSAIMQGNIVERSAINNAYHLLLTSKWAADSAITFYGADSGKVSIVNFGANINRIPKKEELVKEKGNQFNILFLGVNWLRKGGDIAYKAFVELRKKGIPCTLTIVGSNPKLDSDENIRIIPFLDKNKPDDADELYDILINSHLLLLPTRADCTPVVFSEAAAFGLPVITTDTGGVCSVVKNDLNGYTLPLSAEANEYSEIIEGLWNDKEKYKQLRDASRLEYETRLNWDNWVYKFNGLIENARKQTS